MWTPLSKRPPVVLQHHASLYLHQGGFVSVGLLLINYCTDFYRTVTQVFIMRVPIMSIKPMTQDDITNMFTPPVYLNEPNCMCE